MANHDDSSALSAALAGLGRDVEAVRRALNERASAEEVERLARVVADLADMVTPPTNGNEGAVSSWLAFPPADEPGEDHRAQWELLADLIDWLGTIYLRYADAAKELPECWLWHPDIVEELLWLQQAWAEAYGEAGSVRAAGDWHDRLRPGVVRRIGEYAKACSLENHLPDRAADAPQVPVVDAAEAIALWWADARDERPPAPTDDQMIEAAAAARRARTGGGR